MVFHRFRLAPVLCVALAFGCESQTLTFEDAAPFFRENRSEADYEEFLVEHPESVIMRNGLGETLLHDVAAAGNAEATQAFLNQHADPFALDNRGASAMSFAACLGHVDVCRLLIQAGADPNEVSCAAHARDETQCRSTLDLAAFSGQMQTVKLFVQEGGEVNRTEHGRHRSAIHWAVGRPRHFNPELIEYLYAITNPESLMTADGNDPLEEAVERGNRLAAEYLRQRAETEPQAEK